MRQDDFWIAADNNGTYLFYGPKPELISGGYISAGGPIGKLPSSKFPMENYRIPKHCKMILDGAHGESFPG